ncbi:hypothetical protein MARPO_0023s0033 [Marchantia polymorpha]|uniref:Uncharacterized protein n=1 Tax=Marchantia polymorpha TaxID=3197 RepID=A0A2R6XC59_MARPO|nr:hypothetical protein MARPO_0023s0033 [Marchantia polymorpha]|eukprot:PTQ43701.1 hypothetical protein MARPO_0023s0033 [Marchantia polymorpha]
MDVAVHGISTPAGDPLPPSLPGAQRKQVLTAPLPLCAPAPAPPPASTSFPCKAAAARNVVVEPRSRPQLTAARRRWKHGRGVKNRGGKKKGEYAAERRSSEKIGRGAVGQWGRGQSHGHLRTEDGGVASRGEEAIYPPPPPACCVTLALLKSVANYVARSLAPQWFSPPHRRNHGLGKEEAAAAAEWGWGWGWGSAGDGMGGRGRTREGGRDLGFGQLCDTSTCEGLTTTTPPPYNKREAPSAMIALVDEEPL